MSESAGGNTAFSADDLANARKEAATAERARVSAIVTACADISGLAAVLTANEAITGAFAGEIAAVFKANAPATTAAQPVAPQTVSAAAYAQGKPEAAGLGKSEASTAPTKNPLLAAVASLNAA